ncbi:MAG: hypothetical protein ACYDBV_11750 [Nitrospiria bacterium]
MPIINWQDVLTNVGTTLVSSGVIVGGAAWLIKTLVSDHLARDADKFKIQLKADVDKEIERLKAFLTRASHVHERQLDILQNLYGHLFDAQGLFKRMTSAGRVEGEITTEEYAPLVTKAMESAHDELMQGRLFIPPALAQQCDSFFNLMFKGRQNFYLAHHPMVDPGQQAKFWQEAATIAHQEVPKILQQIDEAARAMIHGEKP